jgi:hypothetical protein
MGLLASWRSSSARSALGGALIGAGWLYTRRSAIMSQALRKSLEACVELQREAIIREQPDIVVGSSWGGAVAVELMRAEIWRGPTILLAPAVHRVAARTNTGNGDDIAGSWRRGAPRRSSSMTQTTTPSHFKTVRRWPDWATWSCARSMPEAIA